MTRAHLDKQPDEIAAMFDRVAARYDLMNDLMSGGIHRLWKDAMVEWLDPRPWWVHGPHG